LSERSTPADLEIRGNPFVMPYSLPASLEEAKIACLPSCAFYISDFISAEEERVILDKV